MTMTDQMVDWTATIISVLVWLAVTGIVVWALRDMARIYNEWRQRSEWIEHDNLCRFYRERGDKAGLDAMIALYDADQWRQREARRRTPKKYRLH